MIVLDTPDGIAAFQAIRLYHALKIEVKTGMTHSQGSVMNHIKQNYLPDSKSRTKKAVLDEFYSYLTAVGVLQKEAAE
jgi:hypothetical protein